MGVSIVCVHSREKPFMTGEDKNTEVGWGQIMEGLVQILDCILKILWTWRTPHGYLSAEPYFRNLHLYSMEDRWKEKYSEGWEN